MLENARTIYWMLDPSERKRLYGLLVAMVIAAVMGVVSIASIYPLLDVLTDPSTVEGGGWLASLYAWGGFESVNSFALAVALGSLTAVILANGAIATSIWLQQRYTAYLRHTLSTRLLRTYLERDYETNLTINSSRLAKNVLKETQDFVNGVIRPSLQVVSRGLMILAVLGFLIVFDPVLTLVLVGVVGGGYLVAYRLIRTKVSHLGTLWLQAHEERYKASTEALGGFKEVKTLGAEGEFVSRYRPASEEAAQHEASRSILQEVPRFIIEALAFGGLILILLVLLASGEPTSTVVPVMGLFAFGGYRLMPAFQALMASATSIRFNDQLVLEIKDDLVASADEGPHARHRAPEPPPFEQTVRLDGITYRYPNADRDALKDVTLEIPKDSAVAFVGETGAGKTTLIDVILGLLRPQDGSLLVDGTEVTDETMRNWRALIGYVPQEIYLTDDTIRRNIAFGVPEDQIDQAAVEHAARVAHIHSFIDEELPDGYDTVVGERGVRLSGGQRQRIGIARALYQDPEILIFDEATSDIDGITEANIMEAVEELKGEVTMVLIAHRINTVRKCDMIHMIDEGRVVVSGSYEDLMEKSERFRAMANGDAGDQDALTVERPGT